MLDGTVWNAEAGRMLSSRANRVAQAINEYNEDLHLAWIPPEHREVGDIPYAVIHRPKVGAEYVAFLVTEDELESALARVIMNDTSRTNPMAAVEAAEIAATTIMAKKRREEMLEAHEIAYSILRSKKHAYKHGGKVYR